MKLYFTDDDGNILEQIRAENHDNAVAIAQVANSNTSFYSTDTI